MGISYNPRIVTDGLVLAFDVANGIKNATGNISTNLIQNGNFVNGAGSPQESDSNATNTIIELANPGNSPFVLRQNGNNTEYQFNVDSGMIANTTYVMSGWYAKSSDYDGGDTMFHARAFSSSGAHNATGVDTGTLIYSTVVNSITWQFRYQTITTPADFSGAFDWYTGYGTNNTTGYRYYTNLRLERGTYPSLYNLLGTGNNGEVQNGVSYNSSNGGSLVFDGVNDYLDCGTPSIGTGKITVNAWVKINAGSLFQHIVDSASNAWHLAILSDNRPYFWNGSTYHTAAPILTVGQWYMLTGVQGTTLDIYINGVLGQSLASNLNVTTNNVIIGAYQSASRPFNGNIATTQVYNRALSATEISQNYNALRGRYGI
jgi:hypothetical protein